MCAVRNQNLSPLLATITEIGRRDQKGCELALGARRWLETDRVQAGDFRQNILKVVEDRQQALERAFVLVGMLGSKSRKRARRSFRLGLYFIVHDPSG